MKNADTIMNNCFEFWRPEENNRQGAVVKTQCTFVHAKEYLCLGQSKVSAKPFL
jgi:hypothetical protein